MAAGVGDRRKGGEAIARESGMDMYTHLYFKWMTNKALVCTARSSTQCQQAASMEGSLGESGYTCM